MDIAQATIAATVEACWKVFTTPERWIDWVPGLRSLHVLAHTTAGLPSVIRCEYSAGVTYTLHYTYDLERHIVRWTPGAGERGGVLGYARFEAVPEGTSFTYALGHDGTRTAVEALLDQADAIADAFARTMAR